MLQDPFTDVSASTLGELNTDLGCVWSITVNGEVYHRTRVSSSNPEGTEWIAVPVAKGVQDAAQVTVAANGTPIVVTWTGGILFRVGITPHRLEGIYTNCERLILTFTVLDNIHRNFGSKGRTGSLQMVLREEYFSFQQGEILCGLFRGIANAGH